MVKALTRRLAVTAKPNQLAFGDNNDGMWLFSYAGHSILAVNHEYVSRETFFGTDRTDTLEAVRKAQAAHGLSYR